MFWVCKKFSKSVSYLPTFSDIYILHLPNNVSIHIYIVYKNSQAFTKIADVFTDISK